MSSLRTGQYFGNACRQIEAPGTVFTELRHARQRSLPFHTHQSAYFSMLLKGGYEEWYLGHTRSYLLNELFFHPDDFGHHDRITTPDTLLLCIAMSRSFQDSMRTRFSQDDRSPRLLRGKSVMIALTMRELLNPGLVPDPIALEEYALELLAAVNQWRSPAESVEPGWLRRSLEILHGSVPSRISLQSLASEVQIHPLHLSRTFRKFHGCSPVTYLQRLRVEFASTQIRTTDIPLCHVAALSGFSDQSHMNRLFKRFLGCTPGMARAHGSRAQ
jgi:AraC family transcriptional regulator